MATRTLRNLAAWLSCLVAMASPGAERTVFYFNEDNDRVVAALGKLRAAVEAQGIPRRHAIRIVHVPVDYEDWQAIRLSLHKAIAARPAAIIVATAPLAQLAREQSGDTPVIFGMHQDPVQLGLAASIRRPGGNMTGLTVYRSDEGKRLELLRELAPGARKLGVVIDEWWDRGPQYRHPSAMLLEQQARELGFEVVLFQLDTLDALRGLPGRRDARAIDAWYVPATRVPFDHPAEVAKTLGELRKPAIYSMTQLIAQGGLISYQSAFEDPFASWAKMLSLILDGFPAGEIPIERPRAFELAVNVKAARDQGIAIPKSILLRATHFY